MEASLSAAAAASRLRFFACAARRLTLRACGMCLLGVYFPLQACTRIGSRQPVRENMLLLENVHCQAAGPQNVRIARRRARKRLCVGGAPLSVVVIGAVSDKDVERALQAL